MRQCRGLRCSREVPCASSSGRRVQASICPLWTNVASFGLSGSAARKEIGSSPQPPAPTRSSPCPAHVQRASVAAARGSRLAPKKLLTGLPLRAGHCTDGTGRGLCFLSSAPPLPGYGPAAVGTVGQHLRHVFPCFLPLRLPCCRAGPLRSPWLRSRLRSRLGTGANAPEPGAGTNVP